MKTSLVGQISEPIKKGGQRDRNNVEVDKALLTLPRPWPCSLQKFEIALKTLGLNLTQDVIQDAVNQYNDNGYIYYNDFCSIVAEHYRDAHQYSVAHLLIHPILLCIFVSCEVLLGQQRATVLAHLPGEFPKQEENPSNVPAAILYHIRFFMANFLYLPNFLSLEHSYGLEEAPVVH